MLRLFTVKNTQFNDEELFIKNLALVDGNRRQRVASLASREGKNASLAAGVILPLALRACGYGGGYKLDCGEWGKPFLTEPDGVFFNISHSGDYTAIAVSDGEVGCDIQRVKPIDPRVAERFFSEEEKLAIEGAGECAEDLFYRIWTAKESYLKALGVGLSRPLSSFTVRLTACGAEISDPRSSVARYITEYAGIDGYKLAVCTLRPVGAIEAQALTVL